jgi:hypothetical protein
MSSILKIAFVVVIPVVIVPTLLIILTCQTRSECFAYYGSVLQILGSLAAVAAFGYGVFVARELRESIKARYLDGIRLVMSLIGTEDASVNRRWVYQELNKAGKPLSPNDDKRLRTICRDFDHIGMLCRHGLLPTPIVTESYYKNIIEMWEHLEPTIKQWREASNYSDLYVEFEWLVAKARKMNDQIARRKRII